MTTRTQWFRIGVDGQPAHVGWWEVKYAGDETEDVARLWWDGEIWRHAPGCTETMFGNSPRCFDDRYRGLAEKPKSGMSSK